MKLTIKENSALYSILQWGFFPTVLVATPYIILPIFLKPLFAALLAGAATWLSVQWGLIILALMMLIFGLVTIANDKKVTVSQ